MNKTFERLSALAALIADKSGEESDGQWLEAVVIETLPSIREYQIEKCERWSEWEEREERFPSSSRQDIGIDAVATTTDGRLVAIQTKARKLDDEGYGGSIAKREIDTFGNATANDVFDERWLVTNGAVDLSPNAQKAEEMRGARGLKTVNLAQDLGREIESRETPDEAPDTTPTGAKAQTRTEMQREAVQKSVSLLREYEMQEYSYKPRGEARGRIVLPCGTGKTRISLQIVEMLTPKGKTSLVLCPSIALVAQIRAEYLRHAETEMRVLAICSDRTAGYDVAKEGSSSVGDDPTADLSNTSARTIKGLVTTDPDKIAAWIEDDSAKDRVNVVFGTYQSSLAIADALAKAKTQLEVLIADEAHRTAGLPKSRSNTENAKRRDFALCHDRERFPAKYRVYQTASPRIYDTRGRRTKDDDLIVRSMDDETIFGVELYRKSYREAVNNGWLSDYRIIAVLYQDDEVRELEERIGKSKRKVSSTLFQKSVAFAIAMAGGTKSSKSEVDIRSCIAFFNTVANSRAMSETLQTKAVREFVANHFARHKIEGAPKPYKLEHVDAKSNVTARDNAKHHLAQASKGAAAPHGVFNVGIFGEGTDSPSLGAVAFLEPRKSPIDVLQAVGRAMRRSENKRHGYVFVPILIPPNVDAEEYLATSGEDGWKELGQVLKALRAHDERIETALADLMEIYLPTAPPPGDEFTLIAHTSAENEVQHYAHRGKTGTATADAHRRAQGEGAKESGELTLLPTDPDEWNLDETMQRIVSARTMETKDEQGRPQVEVRVAPVARAKPKANELQGAIDPKKTRKRSIAMANREEGHRVSNPLQRERRREAAEESAQMAFRQMGWDEHSDPIRVNLLERSGLTGDKVERDLNLLRDAVETAARALKDDDLVGPLNAHYGYDNLAKSDKRADGATVAALQLMNAAMLHQRIAKGRWIPRVKRLEEFHNAPNIMRQLQRQWNAIRQHDFVPVIKPALEATEKIEDTGRTAGLERALRHIAGEAAHIAEVYADMGADHAGALFNEVMGDQDSDGAFFTRPTAASLLARLTLDAAEPDGDWTSKKTWARNTVFDPACGSGTILQAFLAEMKRRARAQGASEEKVGGLHRYAVEETIKGFDINPISLQLAATRLTTDNRELGFRKLGLHLMPYGMPERGRGAKAGTLELLSQQKILSAGRVMKGLDLEDERVGDEELSVGGDSDVEIRSAADAAAGNRIGAMNPPFTNRTKMAEKFTKDIQARVRSRADTLQEALVREDPRAVDKKEKNSIAPLFVALADKCIRQDDGLLAMINPSIVLSAPSGESERKMLAERYEVDTILTGHDPREPELSVGSEINESILVLRRSRKENRPARIITLDRNPKNEREAQELHDAITSCETGSMGGNWGEISHWPQERIREGDWAAGIWRSSKIANAAYELSKDETLVSLDEAKLKTAHTDLRQADGYEPCDQDTPGSFPAIRKSGEDGQTQIEAHPDGWYIRRTGQKLAYNNDKTDTLEAKKRENAGHLLISAGQGSRAGRLTAVASETRFVGQAWMPSPKAMAEQAKALAVFLNSTAGRIQMMQNAGRKLRWPKYRGKGLGKVRVPDPQDARVMRLLADAWERTKDMEVPTYGEGECEVRRLWDEAVAKAIGYNAKKLEELRHELHREPHVCGRRLGKIA